MSNLNEIRTQRLAMYSAPTTFEDSIVNHIEFSINNFQSSAVLIRAAEQNIPLVRGKIIEYVAKIDNWEFIDTSSYSSFEVACNSLYLKYNILIHLHQKEMSSPDYSFTDLNCAGYTKVYYDLELNSTDPYFDKIKRDYYNDVSI